MLRLNRTIVKMSKARGDTETAQLKNNIQSQLNRLINFWTQLFNTRFTAFDFRLLTQLRDLEEMKDDMEPAEFEQSRNETLEQMQEFQESLRKMLAGDMTLVDDIGKMQLAIQTAIRNAFKSPEVIQMFEKKENRALRSRLASLEESFKLGRITADIFSLQRREVLEVRWRLDSRLFIHINTCVNEGFG